MSYLVELTQEAETNRDEIYRYYLERSELGAHHWYLAYEGAISFLEQNPNRFGVASEDAKHSVTLQQINFGTKPSRPTHRLIFTVDGNRVTVLTLRHLHQDRWHTEPEA